MKKIYLFSAILILTVCKLYAQKLTVDQVYKTYLRNSGTIESNKQIKGYYFLYLSDKIDKKTNEYTLQILDENLNKVKDIKFQDTKKLSLLEAAYNGNSLAFLFKNSEDKTLDMKIYGLDGKMKYIYTIEYTNKTDELLKQYETLHTDDGTNQRVYDLGTQGYASVLPLRDGKQRTYQVNYYSSVERKQWTYEPTDDEERFANAEFLGSTDSLIILEVMKKNRLMSGEPTSHLVGINFITKKKVFDLDDSKDKFTFVPSNTAIQNGTGNILVMGSYFNKEDNIVKDFSQGLAIYTIDQNGNVLTRAYNTWANDFSKYLPVNQKGKIEGLGFPFIHKIIQGADGKLYAIGEGYKRQVNVGGIALTAAMAMMGGRSNAGVTKIVITDMILMNFDANYKVTAASIFEKHHSNAVTSNMSDYNSQHAIAMLLKMSGAFDYDFTTGEPDNSTFTVCYDDWERSDEYKGKTFNSIHYNGNKFKNDKIELKSKATLQRIFPAKAGNVMIMEYYKRDKKLEFRLEKLG